MFEPHAVKENSSARCVSEITICLYPYVKARSSGGERYLDTVEVEGSKPSVPTMSSHLPLRREENLALRNQTITKIVSRFADTVPPI